MAEWKALQQEVVDVEYSLPGSDVLAYQHALLLYGARNRELRLLLERYRAK
ncbi:MAG: hypothetical protein KME20_12775 [Kaiparowitsia implicata GSE-PSE-MK54-09C]|nr:hypothetical protein [Kaiparowitsia implicata GSE-PSE-MK54-09C]